jgi:predicted MFS family arabinose efflux permease
MTGLATSFLMLLGTRLLMGFAEGGVAPISQSITVLAVPPERRGLAMGIMQNFGSNLFGSFVAPVLLVGIATAWGWQRAFFVAGVPGLLSALLLWHFVREPHEDRARGSAVREPLASRLGAILGQRNMVLCALISVLLVSYVVICWTFAPLFLTQVRGLRPGTMSWLMGTLGISATVGSFVVSGISDRIGRRPVMIGMAFAGTILPLGALYHTGSPWALAAIFFVGWGLNGVFPLFMGTIPSESVKLRHMTTAIALVMGTGEVFGGVLSPTLAGWAADRAGLAAPLWIMLGLCVASGLLALGLTETAPRRRSLDLTADSTR